VSGEPAQVVVNQGYQLIDCVVVAAAPFVK